MPDNVRFGSEADICSAKRDVRFTLESRLETARYADGQAFELLRRRHRVANVAYFRRFSRVGQRSVWM
jgi:hypothetical protein